MQSTLKTVFSLAHMQKSSKTQGCGEFEVIVIIYLDDGVAIKSDLWIGLFKIQCLEAGALPISWLFWIGKKYSFGTTGHSKPF